MENKNIYDQNFKDGDFVFIITDNDVFDGGYLATKDDGIILRLNERRDRFYPFYVIRFMAHDGFPVNKVCCTEPDPDILFLKDILSKHSQTHNNEKNHKIEKFINSKNPELKHGKKSREVDQEIEEMAKYFTKKSLTDKNFITGLLFGDPYEITDVFGSPIVDDGNLCLNLLHPNGSKAILYDLMSVWDYSVEKCK